MRLMKSKNGKSKLPKEQQKFYERQKKKLKPYGIKPIRAIYVKGMKTPVIEITKEDLGKMVDNYCCCSERFGEPYSDLIREAWENEFPGRYLLDDEDQFFYHSPGDHGDYECTQYAMADTWFSRTFLGILAYMKAVDYGYEFYDSDVEPFERMLEKEGIEDDPANLKKALKKYCSSDEYLC